MVPAPSGMSASTAGTSVGLRDECRTGELYLGEGDHYRRLAPMGCSMFWVFSTGRMVRPMCMKTSSSWAGNLHVLGYRLPHDSLNMSLYFPRRLPVVLHLWICLSEHSTVGTSQINYMKMPTTRSDHARPRRSAAISGRSV